MPTNPFNEYPINLGRPPSGQGIADKATLIGRGVTVNTN